MRIIFDGKQPIYRQIMQDIKQRLVSNLLKPGEKLPSVRDWAAQLGVTPNTLQRAFAELEREGLVRTERTSGRYITRYEGKLMALRQEMSYQAVVEYLTAMSALGFDLEQAREAVNDYAVNEL
jgi:DNA-binding transcriptional regulator YhcF (GntR family)